jgi:hypothetical protein
MQRLGGAGGAGPAGAATAAQAQSADAPASSTYCGVLHAGDKNPFACRAEDAACHMESGHGPECIGGEPGRKRRIETEQDAENLSSNVERERPQAGRQPPLGVVRQLCLEAAESRFLVSQRGGITSRCPLTASVLL